MASQMVATAGLSGRKLKRNQVSELEAKLPFLKQMQAQKLQKSMHADTMKLANKRLSMETKQAKKSHKFKKKGMALEQLTAEREMGISAAKFGTNMVLSGKGGTLSQIGNKFGGMFGGKSASAQMRGKLQGGMGQPTLPGMIGGGGGTITAGTSGGGSFFGNLSPGNLIGSGLAGFGASRFVKGKGKRMLMGGLAGGLMSLFGGGASAGGALGGAIFGGLGGLL